MKILEGKSVFPGIAIGKIQVWMEEWDQVKRVHVPDRNQELRRLDEAKEKAIVELKELHQKAEIEAGSSEAEIFEVRRRIYRSDKEQDPYRKCECRICCHCCR